MVWRRSYILWLRLLACMWNMFVSIKLVYEFVFISIVNAKHFYGKLIVYKMVLPSISKKGYWCQWTWEYSTPHLDKKWRNSAFIAVCTKCSCPLIHGKKSSIHFIIISWFSFCECIYFIKELQVKYYSIFS